MFLNSGILKMSSQNNKHKLGKYQNAKHNMLTNIRTACDINRLKPSEDFQIFFKKQKLLTIKEIRKILKTRKISQEFSKIINEEYKSATINNQTQFLMLYRRNADIDMAEYFKEGEESPRVVPSFLMTQMFHFCVGILFFLKFLNNVLNWKFPFHFFNHP